MNKFGLGVWPIVEAAHTWGHDGHWSVATRLPMIVTDEVADLSAHYGTPVLRSFHVQADDYIYSYRFKKASDRRAEVVFAIEDGCGHLWVHTKPHYPAHIFRLPSGGVNWDELVIEGLMREVNEETALPVEIVRFLGIIEYHFWHNGVVAPFVSYVFHLYTPCVDRPVIQCTEQISEFRTVLPNELAQMAVELRSLIGNRRAWGQWRALAHDLVYETLLT